MSDLDDFRATLARQAEAEAAFHQGNPGPRMELWSRRDQVALFGAAGMFKSGWDELSRIFPWVSSRFSKVTDYRFEVAGRRRRWRHGVRGRVRALRGIDRRSAG